MKLQNKTLLITTLASLTLGTTVLASPPRDIPAPKMVPNSALDADGYPKQFNHRVQELDVSKTTFEDVFRFEVDGQIPLYAQNADITYSGIWQKVGSHRVARERDSSSTHTFDLWEEITKETAMEMSASLSVGVTGSFAPFGIGGEVTVEASVGFAMSVATANSMGRGKSVQTEVKPGEELQLWVREVVVEARWKPADFNDYLDNMLIPSQVAFHRKLTNGKGLPGQTLEQFETELRKQYKTPTGMMNAITGFTKFLKDNPNGLVTEYSLPTKDVYEVVYKF